ncbi:BH3-interacting domain death agonist-like [Pristis pectinata]|uniref:BH3-interacting domain death agonist-like n=1 Tax=Pristis pectinata TaxID=685728 RepID=UPI00223CB4B5|nr:BH3-interacting domain death agonist-like [Pristis pectinata]XP_051886445.1 BH3-interacting domain death agonist-like [Pristis pectinata]XP_051886446.1 BH3-interacting domain death agonist-like [Pristis pectinata]XP_051886447.1 BH3-interacting domain death agonist-like [Pristis pectinata]
MSLETDLLFEKQTQYILLIFLKAKKFENLILREEICKLEKEVIEELASDDDIQTDGHCSSLSFSRSAVELEAPFVEELYRDIGVRLAQMGDGLDRGINRDVVEGFIRANERIRPQEDGTATLSAIINGLTNQRTTVVQDMPREKGVLLLTLLLLEKTVLEQPRLLPRLFRTTVQYITTRLQTYIQYLGGWEHLH